METNKPGSVASERQRLDEIVDAILIDSGVSPDNQRIRTLVAVAVSIHLASAIYQRYFAQLRCAVKGDL